MALLVMAPHSVTAYVVMAHSVSAGQLTSPRSIRTSGGTAPARARTRPFSGPVFFKIPSEHADGERRGRVST